MIALIPARKGSKRIEGKCTKLLGGVPLIRWTIEAAKDSGCFEDIWVCTDDSDCIAEALYMGVMGYERDAVPDDQRDIEWVREVLSCWGTPWEDFAILRPTSPFRGPETIQRAKAQWDATKDDLDSMRAMRPVTEHPYKAWIVERETVCSECAGWGERWFELGSEFETGEYCPDCAGRAVFNTMVPITTAAAKKHLHSMPTQSLTEAYIQTAGLEMCHTKTVLEGGTLAGDQVGMFLVEGPEALDINDEAQWAEAERILASRTPPNTP